ncbi:MAG: hypothetical protein IPO01_00780 [Chitinophagaceae bacterium]|nr:hypothetical protein [Chitinophagaceae bacterium]
MLQFAGLISGGCLFLILIVAISDTAQPSTMVQMGSGDNGLIKTLGMVLFKDYVLPLR